MRVSSVYHHTHAPTLRTFAESAQVKRCFVVPGQGSAYPGMFAAYLSADADFRELFSAADLAAAAHDLLPFSLYLTNAQSLPSEQLHIYRNCALFTTQVALGRSLLRQGLAPDMITGHSFGECAGIVLAGLMSFDDMMEVVILRNLICPPAYKLGAMITLSATQEKIATLLAEDGVYLANINSLRQLVLSVRMDQKEKTLHWLRQARIPHLLLSELPQPYHSPLMIPYQEELKTKLIRKKLVVHSPAVDFFSGITHQWIRKQNYQQTDFADLLSRQFTEPVDFVQQISEAYEHGARSFYEMGPGQMLEHSMKGILQDKAWVYRDMEKHFSLLVETAKPVKANVSPTSKWFLKIKEIIRSVTGYGDEDIRLQDSFQNDLGIDSLRKAEILVRLIKEQGLNPSADFAITRFAHIHEAVEYLENYTESVDPLMTAHQAKLSLLTPRWVEAPLPQQRLLVQKSDKISEWNDPSGIPWSELCANGTTLAILRWGTQAEIQKFAPAKEIENYKVFLQKTSQAPLHIIVNDSSENNAAAPWVAFLRSLSKESKRFTVGHIHSPGAQLSWQILQDEACFAHLRDVRYEQGRRFVKELYELQTNSAPAKPLNVLAVGGAKGIGLEVLMRAPAESCGTLLVVGRTKATDPGLQEPLNNLRQRWAKLHYLSLDAAELAQAREQIGAFFEQRPIDILFNSAGTEISRSFDEREPNDVLSELQSKIAPYDAIERFKASYAVHKTFHCTSVVSQFGNKGQAIYSWSNTWIEGHLGAGSHALAWAPWEGVGMTANPGMLQKIREWGMSLMTPEDGARLTWQLFQSESELPTVIVPMDAKDVLLLSVEHYNKSSLGKLIHNFEAVFYKDISLEEESFLKDHVLLSQQLVPAAYFLSQMLSLARAQFSRIVSIRDFKVLNALIFQEGHAAYKMQCFWRDPFQFSIYSIIPHASGQFMPEKSLGERSYLPSREERSVLMESFYDQNGFGKAFQFIRQAFIDKDNNVRVEVRVDQLLQLSSDPVFDFWLVLIDMAFQALTMQMKLIDGGAIIPLSVGEILIRQDLPLTNVMSFYPQIKEVKGKFGMADITFTNEQGAVFLEMKETRYKIHYFKDFTPIAVED